MSDYPGRWCTAGASSFDLAGLNETPIAVVAVKRIDVLFATVRKITRFARRERSRVHLQRSSV
jgi:hypothetical protein